MIFHLQTFVFVDNVTNSWVVVAYALVNLWFGINVIVATIFYSDKRELSLWSIVASKLILFFLSRSGINGTKMAQSYDMDSQQFWNIL